MFNNKMFSSSFLIFDKYVCLDNAQARPKHGGSGLFVSQCDYIMRFWCLGAGESELQSDGVTTVYSCFAPLFSINLLSPVRAANMKFSFNFFSCEEYRKPEESPI